jgi:hypothetical protein
MTLQIWPDLYLYEFLKYFRMRQPCPPTDLNSSFSFWGLPSYTVTTPGNHSSAAVLLDNSQNKVLEDRNAQLKEIAKTTFRLDNIIKSEKVKAVFFLDRSSRLAESALQAVRELKEDNSSLIIDHLNPDFFKRTSANIDRMIRKAYSEVDATCGKSMSKLFMNFNKMKITKDNLSEEDQRKFSRDIKDILENASASELVRFVKNNILIKLASDQENQESLRQRLEQQGLKPEDKILIYDICSHSGAAMNAVTEAFKSIGYKNLNPVVMNPPLKDNKKHYNSLTDHPSFKTCYPFSIAKHSSKECLKKPPESLTCEIKDPVQLEQEQMQMHRLIKTYLAKHL